MAAASCKVAVDIANKLAMLVRMVSSVEKVQIASAVFALAAAVLWFLSARIRIPEEFSIRVHRPGSFAAKILSRGNPADIGATQGESEDLVELGRALFAQGTWSKWAAACACVAALLQGLATLSECLHLFS